MTQELLSTMYGATDENAHEVLRKMMTFTMKSFQEGNATTVNNFLGALEPDRLRSIVCSAVLRTTFSQRQNLPNWIPLRDRIVESFKARGVPDWERKLMGLLNLLNPPKRSGLERAFDQLMNVHPTLQRK